MDRLKKYKLSVINKLTNNYNKNINALKNKILILRKDFFKKEN